VSQNISDIFDCNLNKDNKRSAWFPDKEIYCYKSYGITE